MVRQPTTRLQISGYRFLMRRLEHALVRGDVRMLDDPLRAQSLSSVAGCVLAVIAVAACAMLALLRPHGALGDAPIVMARESGALYVRIGDTLHPVMNLTSAWLIAGAPARPELVSQSAINTAKRGPLVGIPGAPVVIGEPLGAGGWTVCDNGGLTTVIVGKGGLGEGLRPLATGDAILVSPQTASGAETYLLYGGQRARVDLRDRSVVRALRLEGARPQPVSRALLDSVPEVAPVTAPTITGAGSAGPRPLRGFTVGTVVRLVRADTVDYYVVLADGIQRIGRVTADLILFTSPQDNDIATELPALNAATVASVPAVDRLAVATHPERSHPVSHPIVCAHWELRGDGGHPSTAILVGDSLPLDDRTQVSLAQSDGMGPHVDAVAMSAGRSAYLRSTGVTGGGGGPLFVMTESGVLFGIRDETVARQLGISVPAVPAPWPMLASLPRGPELSKEGASVVRDSVAPA